MQKVVLMIFGWLKPEMIGTVIEGVQRVKKALTEGTKAEDMEIVVPISSSGGEIAVAFSLYNVLTNAPCKVVTHNIGEVASSANIVFLAGRERFATEYSLFKFHLVTWTFATQGAISNTQVEDAHVSIDQYQKMMAAIFKAATKMTDDEITESLTRTLCFNPATAKKRGIIHDTRPF